MTWKPQLLAARAAYLSQEYAAVRDFGLPELKKPYRDTTTNDLTNAVIDWCKYHGCYVARTNTTGAPRIVNGKPILVKTKRGKSDIDVTHEGRTIKIEIKCDATKDRLSEFQYREYLKVTKAGGLYLVIGNMQQFADWWGMYSASIRQGVYPLYYPQPYELEALDYSAYPLINREPVISLQPVIQPPKHREPTGELIPGELPTLDEWRKAEGNGKPKKGKGKGTLKQGTLATPPDSNESNIIRAHFGKSPSFVKYAPANHRSDAELQQAITSLQAQGFRIAFRPCLYYITKPEDKLYKRLPKGYTLVDTPMDDGTWEKRVIGRDGCQALEFEVEWGMSRLTAAEVVTGFKRRAEMQEKFCIPEFIISERNGAPTHPDGYPCNVYVLDPKRDTNDGKMFHYIKVLKAAMAAKGDNRKVKGGAVAWPGEEVSSIFKVFKV